MANSSRYSFFSIFEAGIEGYKRIQSGLILALLPTTTNVSLCRGNVLSSKQPDLSNYSWPSNWNIKRNHLFKSSHCCCRHLVLSCGFKFARDNHNFFYICQRWQIASEGSSFRLNFLVISYFIGVGKSTDLDSH